ncbi:MAG: TraR/DksA C4-type zinc finger protein [Nitrospirae bacterium]|nr:TraR/DksA C4-type zinc finger protein [Nitrospirota bacterium]
MPTSKIKIKNATEDRSNKYEDIRLELERQRNALLAEAGELIGSGLNPEKENYPDLSDQASAESEQNFVLRLKGREQKLLKKIDEALERILDNTYGICESCGEEITRKRLMARPVTTLCIECKTKQEEDEKLRG